MSQPKTTVTDDNIDKILSIERHKTLRIFIDKKVAEMSFSSPGMRKTGKRWLFKVVRVYSGKEVWNDICSNLRKMECVYKVWMTRFHGYGLEKNLGVKIIGRFRTEASAELRRMNQKAVASRKKYDEKKKKQEEVYSDDDAVDYFNMERVKLWNNRTSKKNIAPKIPTIDKRAYEEVKGLRITTGPDGEEDWAWESTPPTAKRLKTNSTRARRVSRSPTNEPLSLSMEGWDSSSDEE